MGLIAGMACARSQASGRFEMFAEDDNVRLSRGLASVYGSASA
jgi:hypothetical protein